MEDEMIAHIAGGVITLVLVIFLTYCFCSNACKSIREARVAPVDAQNIQTIELRLPSYEEAIRNASSLARTESNLRRRNPTDDNMTSGDGRDDTGTQSQSGETEEATGVSNIEDGGNNRDDSGVMFNLGEDSDDSSKRDEKGYISNVVNDSGIKSISGEDAVDNFDDVSSKYDTASGSSTGGGTSIASLPWVRF